MTGSLLLHRKGHLWFGLEIQPRTSRVKRNLRGLGGEVFLLLPAGEGDSLCSFTYDSRSGCTVLATGHSLKVFITLKMLPGEEIP